MARRADALARTSIEYAACPSYPVCDIDDSFGETPEMPCLILVVCLDNSIRNNKLWEYVIWKAHFLLTSNKCVI